MNKTICHISFNHDAFDDRIYWKELISLKEAGFETFHICVGEIDSDFVSNEGVRIIQVKRINSTRNIWLKRIEHQLFGTNPTIRSIFLHARNTNASIYHFHDFQINAIVKPLKRLSQKPKLIYDCHEVYHLLMLRGTQLPLMGFFLKKIISTALSKWEIKNARLCDHIIANFPFVKTYFERYTPTVPATLIHNYTYKNRFAVKAECTEIKKYDFIYAGHLSEERAVDRLIHAFSILASEKKDSSFLLIGPMESESYSKKLTAIIKSYCLEENVAIHKPVSFSALTTFYKQSKIGLCVLKETEVFKVALPGKLFEYMEFGLPVIFSNHGPAADIIKKTDCGLLVDFDDIGSIASGMKILLNDTILFEKKSNNGKRAIIEEYNWEKEKEKLIDIYRTLLHDNQNS